MEEDKSPKLDDIIESQQLSQVSKSTKEAFTWETMDKEKADKDFTTEMRNGILNRLLEAVNFVKRYYNGRHSKD